MNKGFLESILYFYTNVCHFIIICFKQHYIYVLLLFAHYNTCIMNPYIWSCFTGMYSTSICYFRVKFYIFIMRQWNMRLFFINARECMNLLVIESTTHSCDEATLNVLTLYSTCIYRPEMSADDVSIEIKQGRHPVIQHLIGEGGQYVPNDTLLQVSANIHCKGQVQWGGGLHVFQMTHTGFFFIF